MSRGTLVWVLILVAVGAAIVGGWLWHNEDHRIARPNRIDSAIDWFSGAETPKHGTKPAHHLPSFVLFGVGGATFLFGALVVAGMSTDEWRDFAGPHSKPEPISD